MAMMLGKYNYIGLSQVMSSAVFTAPSIQLTQQNPHTNIDEIQLSGVKVRKEQESIYKNNVYFRESSSNAYLSVGLSGENLSKLKAVFGENAVKSEDDKILLKGKAEEFVSAWFNDIAYKRGYIRADANNDGFLNIGERKNTNSFTLVELYGFGSKNFHINPIKNYTKDDIDFNSHYDTIDIFTSSSIEEELNKMIKLDEDMNGIISKNQIWEISKYKQYLDKIIENEEYKGYIPPSFEEAFFAFIQTMKDTKEGLEEKLKKANDTSIDLNAFDSSTATSTTNLFDDETDETTFNEIAKLTKLDKQTLAYNLKNNKNFEENIISIVQELMQNVDALYALKTANVSSISQKTLDIKI